MKRQDFSAEAWEDRVFALLSAHPGTERVLDARQLELHERDGVDGIWRVTQEGRVVEVPFSIHMAAPGTREVRFETSVLHGRDTYPGAALRELAQLAFIFSPESRAVLTVPAHHLRDLLGAERGYHRSVTQVGRDAKGARLSERVLVPLQHIADLPGATVSDVSSWQLHR